MRRLAFQMQFRHHDFETWGTYLFLPPGLRLFMRPLNPKTETGHLYKIVSVVGVFGNQAKPEPTET